MAIQRPKLKFFKGSTYVIDQSDASNAGHPLKFTADSGTSEYTSGVTATGTPGQAGANITFVVPNNAPENMMYYCTTHGVGMGQKIKIITDPSVKQSYGDRGIIFNASSSLDGGNDNHSQRIEYFDITTTGNAAAFGLMTQKQDPNNSYNTDRGVSNGSRAVACLYHGPYPGTIGNLEYVTPSTLGNSVAFGTNTFRESLMGLSDGTKAYYAGGPWGGGIYGSGQHTNLGTNVEVVTIDTTGNATDTGYGTPNLTSGATHGNTSRGIFAGGREDNNSGTTDVNYSTQMYYISFPLSAGSSDFGDLQEGRSNAAGTGSTTRACFAGGSASNSQLKINYVEIATTGNASNFGDLDAGRNKIGATGNNTRGVFIGGYTGVQVDTMNYITFATTGDATDFGDMTAVGTGAQAMSGNA